MSQSVEPRVEPRALSRYDTHFMLFVFAVAYAALLIPRAFVGMIFDRYLLPLVMVLAILLLRQMQERAGKISYLPGWITLFFFTCFAVAGTHDLYAFDRARVTALDEVTRSGVPRTSVEGGFEYATEDTDTNHRLYPRSCSHHGGSWIPAGHVPQFFLCDRAVGEAEVSHFVRCKRLLSAFRVCARSIPRVAYASSQIALRAAGVLKGV